MEFRNKIKTGADKMKVTIILDQINSKNSVIMRDKKNYRKKRLLELLSQGYTQREISKKIGCSLSTIEKDLKEIRNSEMEIE